MQRLLALFTWISVVFPGCCGDVPSIDRPHVHAECHEAEAGANMVEIGSEVDICALRDGAEREIPISFVIGRLRVKCDSSRVNVLM